MKQYPILAAGLLCLSACGTSKLATDTAPASAPAFFSGSLTDYWYAGEAEITTYDLRQARYGEYREGTAVLIQVTEDFLTDRQVKNDAYTNPASVPIIKTNLLRRFTTGVYDYSIMTSVFTPTGDRMPTLKVTTSAQDWCGQSYTQLNYTGRDRWRMQLRSYFEKEGDQDESLPADFLEDELFNRLRIGGELPVGEFTIVPATAYLLLTHQPYAGTAATISEGEGSADTRSFRVHYPALERTLEIECARTAPFRITGWSETYPSRGELLTTTATVRKRQQLPYWQLNGNKDAARRRELGL